MTRDPLLQTGTAIYTTAIINPQHRRPAAPGHRRHSATPAGSRVIPQGASPTNEAYRRP